MLLYETYNSQRGPLLSIGFSHGEKRIAILWAGPAKGKGEEKGRFALLIEEAGEKGGREVAGRGGGSGRNELAGAGRVRTRIGEKDRDPGGPQQRHRGRERSRFRTLRPEAARREVPRLSSRLVMRGVGLLILPYTEPSPESKKCPNVM